MSDITLTDIKIMDNDLFDGSSEISSYFGNASTAKKFEEIATIVSSKSEFDDKTFFEKLLKFNFAKNSDLKYMNYFNSSSKSSEQCKTGDTSRDTFFNWFENSSNIEDDASYLEDLITDLETDFNDIATDTKDSLLSRGNKSDINAYKKVIRNICKNVFVYHYKTLNSNENGSKFLKNDDATSLKSECEKLCQVIGEDVNNSSVFFIQNCDATNDEIQNSFFGNIIDIIYKYNLKELNFTSNEINEKKYFKKLFVMCFYPYFIFLYMINTIARKNNTSNVDTPRYFFVQRIAILSTYIFLYYTLLSIYNAIPSGDNSDKKTVIQLISDLNDKIIYQERFSDSNKSYHTMQQTTDNTRQASQNISILANEVIKLKNNLTKAGVYDARLQPVVKKSKQYLILGSVFLFITVVGALIMMFLPQINNNFQYMWIFLSIMFVISLFYLIISLFRTPIR